MNKKIIFIVLGIALLAFIIIFAAVRPVAEEPIDEEPVAEEPVNEELIADDPIAEEPVFIDEDPYIQGEVVALSEEKILVAEGVEGEYEGDFENLIGNAVWLTVTGETELLGVQGEKINFDELVVGQRGEFWTVGIILESYPAQATAARIVLTTTDKGLTDKECFIGGCSRELCTDDPEAISTCEFLPGMECLTEEMSCRLVAGECRWVLSEEAANCFLAVRTEQGEGVMQSRIKNLFEKTDEFLSQ